MLRVGTPRPRMPSHCPAPQGLRRNASPIYRLGLVSQIRGNSRRPCRGETMERNLEFLGVLEPAGSRGRRHTGVESRVWACGALSATPSKSTLFAWDVPGKDWGGAAGVGRGFMEPGSHARRRRRHSSPRAKQMRMRSSVAERLTSCQKARVRFAAHAF